MRRIEPRTIPGVMPADLSGQRQPVFELADPRDLYIEDEYQRSVDTVRSTTAIGRILGGFRWSRFKVITCVMVDGKLFVVDGQHTAIACASHPDITVVPVLIVDEPELAERARAFVSHAKDRLAATPGQVWKAQVAAGDAEAVTILQVCEAAGVTLLTYPPAKSAYKAGETIALAAIRAMITNRNPEQAALVLAALKDAGLAPISADAIRAADSLLNDEDYAADFDVDRLAAAFRSLGTKEMADAKALAAAKQLPLWRALVAVIYKSRKRPAPARSSAPEAIRTTAMQPVQILPAPPLRSLPHMPVRTPGLSAYDAGDPAPGRSALDQRRASA